MTVRSLTPALAEKARVELNEEPNRLIEDIQHLKDWIAKQPRLRARIEKFDLYYSVRTAAPELFQVKYTHPIFDVIVNDGVLISLHKTVGPDTPRVTLARMGKINIDKYSIIDIIGTIESFKEIAFTEDDHLTVAGGTLIVDCEGISMAQFTQMTPTLLKKLSVIGRNASPLRMKGIHVIHAPTGVETPFNLMKNLIIEKNRNRFHMHSSLEDLYKHIPNDILPAEYGGHGSTIAEIVDSWSSRVIEYRAFLDEEDNYGTDEHKRPGKPKTAEDMFGADGLFRKLEVD